MLVVRASASDRALDCSGSLIPAEHAYNPNSDEARSGDALHEVMAQHVSDGGADIDRYAQEYDVDLDDLGFLYHRGKQALASLAKHLPKPHVEHSMKMQLAPEVELRGKSDVVSVTEAEEGGLPNSLLELAVVDWKSGYVKRQYAGQVRSYGLLWRDQFFGHMPASGYVLGVEAYLRLGELEVRHMTAADLDGHAAELLHQVHRALSESGTVQYGPGAACDFCPRRNECGARESWARSAAAALEPMGGSVAMTRERIGALYYQAKTLRSSLAQYDKVLSDMLADGPVPLGDGKQVRLILEEQDRINAKALPVLEGLGFTADERERCMRVAKTELLSIVGEKSPQGLGAANKRKVMEALRAAGAVDRQPKREKFVEPVPPTQEQK